MPEVATAEAPVDETTDEHTDAPAPAEPALVEADLLVEDVSIDGMCGVY